MLYLGDPYYHNKQPIIELIFEDGTTYHMELYATSYGFKRFIGFKWPSSGVLISRKLIRWIQIHFIPKTHSANAFIWAASCATLPDELKPYFERS